MASPPALPPPAEYVELAWVPVAVAVASLALASVLCMYLRLLASARAAERALARARRVRAAPRHAGHEPVVLGAAARGAAPQVAAVVLPARPAAHRLLLAVGQGRRPALLHQAVGSWRGPARGSVVHVRSVQCVFANTEVQVSPRVLRLLRALICGLALVGFPVWVAVTHDSSRVVQIVCAVLWCAPRCAVPSGAGRPGVEACEATHVEEPVARVLSMVLMLNDLLYSFGLIPLLASRLLVLWTEYAPADRVRAGRGGRRGCLDASYFFCARPKRRVVHSCVSRQGYVFGRQAARRRAQDVHSHRVCDVDDLLVHPRSVHARLLTVSHLCRRVAAGQLVDVRLCLFVTIDPLINCLAIFLLFHHNEPVFRTCCGPCIACGHRWCVPAALRCWTGDGTNTTRHLSPTSPGGA